LVSKYLHAIKVIVDKLAMIDFLILADDITFYVLSSLGFDFHDIVTLIWNHESSLTFEELYDMLVSH
jgi:hypothetical protein